MLRISWQTLRSRRATLAGAFVAITLAVTLAYANSLLMAGALDAPGPGRFAAADAVVRADPNVTLGRGDDAEKEPVVPAPQLAAAVAARVAAVPGVARAVPDVAFAAGAWDARGHALAAAERLRGHGWSSAALTPYRLAAGKAPAGAHDVVADSRLGVRVGQKLRIVTPAGDATYRVSGLALGRADRDRGQAALFFADGVAAAQSGTPGHVNAIGVVADPGTSRDELVKRVQKAAGGGAEVLAHDHGAEADAGDPRAVDRVGLIAVFGVMGGISGAIALFVVAGTFGLAIAQRRRETAVLRALGATPAQVRRLLGAEALILSAVASALGALLGGPLARALLRVLTDHGIAPDGFQLGAGGLPLLIAVGGGIGVAQVAVIAAARRAGRVRPSEALREVAIEHARPGWPQLAIGVVSLAGGAAMAIIFSGEAALGYSIIGGMLLATGAALLGRLLLGVPAALLSRPLRLLGAPGLLASTSLSANRWRTAALATPIVLITMLVGTQGVGQVSAQKHIERTTEARVTAAHVVVGRDGAPLPAGTAAQLARLPGVRAAAGMQKTSVFLLGKGLGWDAPWAAAGLAIGEAPRTLDLHVRSGRLAGVRGPAVAISRVAAAEGHLEVGDAMKVRLADTRPATLRVAAIYDSSAGLGDVLLDPAVARRHAGTPADDAVFVAGGPAAGRSLARYARAHPGVEALTRGEYLHTLRSANDENAWGVWLVVGLAVIFGALALINTAAMAIGERRSELATIRLLGGTAGQTTRMVLLELAPVLLVALLAGGAIAAAAMSGVPAGVRGFPLVVPVTVIGGLLGGTAVLGLAAAAVSGRLALRASPAAAMRAQE
jgi:putative ABC transport system permease protein